MRDVVREEGRQVGTVGYVKVNPGAINVIPGRVEFPVELRALDAVKNCSHVGTHSTEIRRDR